MFNLDTDVITQQNFAEFRAALAKKLGIGQNTFSANYDGTVGTPSYFALSDDERIDLGNAQVNWIRDHPNQAGNVAGVPRASVTTGMKDIAHLEEKTVAEKATELPGVGEAIDTAYEINKELNPLAFFDSLGKIKWLIIGTVVIGGTLYFVGPTIAKVATEKLLK